MSRSSTTVRGLRVSIRNRKVGGVTICVVAARTDLLEDHHKEHIYGRRDKRFADGVPDFVLFDIHGIRNVGDLGSDYAELALRMHRALIKQRPDVRFALCVPDHRRENFRITKLDRMFPVFSKPGKAVHHLASLDPPPKRRRTRRKSTAPKQVCQRCGAVIHCPKCDG